MDYEDLFPKNKLDRLQFVEDLKRIRKNRRSSEVVSYWVELENEGNMFNIMHVFELPCVQEEIKLIMYSFAEFMTRSDFVEFKKMLGVHGHILEFVHAILNKPEPNLEIIEYFVMVAKSPRHYDPQIIQWFWERVNPLLGDKLDIKRQFLDNCSNSIHRWIVTQKRNKNYVGDFKETEYIAFENSEIPCRLLPNNLKVFKNTRLNFSDWCDRRVNI